MSDQENALRQLEDHARNFLNSDLWSYTGYFTNDFYGKAGAEYYKWSKRAYELIQKVIESQETDAG